MKNFIFLLILLGFFSGAKAQNCDNTLPITENFDTDVINVCWSTIDSDGDGNNWYWWEYSSFYGGHTVIASNSFYTSTGILTPDNWIISHAVDLRSYSASDNVQISWKVRGELDGFSHEYYTVYAATNNTTSAFQSSSVKRGEYVDEVGGDGVFTSRSLNLSALAGRVIYIAFRHHNSTNQYNINIDDVMISTGGSSNCDADSDNDGVCDENDQCPGLNDALIGTPCNDNNPCTINDAYDNNCGCSGTFADADNDGICDANDICEGFDDTIDTDGDGIPDGCEDDATCTETTISFDSNQLSHSGSGSGSKTVTLPSLSQDVTFRISGIGQKTKGKSSSKFIERVKVTYKDASGVNKTNGTYRGDQVSSATINISGYVESITVSLDDAFDGNSETTMNVDLSVITYCGITISCPDGDNDGVCDADDACPNTPANANVDVNGCEITSGCQDTTANFSGNSLSGSNSTTLALAGIGQDVSFSISGINQRLKGKPSSHYTEIVEVLFDNGSGGYQSYGTYNGGSISNVSINIPGPVVALRVILSNELSNTSANMTINFSTVNYCVGSGSSNKSGISKEFSFKTNEISENSFKVYPNPVSGTLFIRTAGLGKSNLKMTLYNIQGVKINSKNLDTRSSQNFEVNVNALPSGLYILKIADENNGLLKTERIIVK